MTSNSSSLSAAPPAPATQPTWWYKPLIWGTFLVLLYVLREFFLIGFLTFLFCFIVRSAVGFLTRLISPAGANRRLDLILTLAVFLSICLALYGLGRYFVPQLIRQGHRLMMQMQHSNAEQVQNALLTSTVGTWRFARQFGTPDDPRYQKGLSQFQAAGRNGEGLYETFPRLHSRLQAEFEASYEEAQVLHLKSHSLQGSAAIGRLEQWFLTIKAPELFHNKSDYYVSDWEAKHASPDKAGELATLRQQPDFESRRDKQIRQRIWADTRSDPVLLAQLRNQWTHVVSIQKWDQFRNSSEYQTQFRTFYQTQFQVAPNKVPIDYSYFKTLATAYARGKQTFLEAVRQHDQQEQESPAHQQFDFESATKLELGQQWWATSYAADWVRDHAAADGPKVLEAVIQRVDEGLGSLVRIPIQIVTALLLAVFMLIEWPGVKSGLADIRNTRLRRIFDEISPGVIALGKLIGKSFQGQVLISFFNACFTLVALWVIGVEYKFLLALVVFVFSFIPVLGVILSGLPICTVAVLQPGGSLLMAVQVIIAIAIIHLIEGMILSPRIIGKIGHLHPVLVIAILLVAEHFFGMWGLVLGVPVAIYVIRVVILDSPIPGIYESGEAATEVTIQHEST
jgi:predicted PurR-regulated permease PerM